MTEGRSIAVAQTIPVRGDVQANLEQHVRLARVAAEADARVVLFPELSLTGYELDLAAELAFSHPDPRLTPLIEAASAHGITLIAGAPVRLARCPDEESAPISADAHPDSRLCIGACIIGPDRTVDVYTKHRLGAFGESARCDGIVPPAEATVFRPATRNPLVGIGVHTAAVAVCADTGQASHARYAAERGASTYLASMFVIPSEFERDAAALAMYAVEHGMAVAVANYGGPSGGLASAGRSSIWSPAGDLLVRLGANGIGVAVAIEDGAGWRTRAMMLDHPAVQCSSSADC